jgi:hypothetical protein
MTIRAADTARRTDLFAQLRANVLFFGILYWGGFFSQINAPQIFFFLVWVLATLAAAANHGTTQGSTTATPQVKEKAVGCALVIFPLVVGLELLVLWWGGFFR